MIDRNHRRLLFVEVLEALAEQGVFVGGGLGFLPHHLSYRVRSGSRVLLKYHPPLSLCQHRCAISIIGCLILPYGLSIIIHSLVIHLIDLRVLAANQQIKHVFWKNLNLVRRRLVGVLI